MGHGDVRDAGGGAHPGDGVEHREIALTYLLDDALNAVRDHYLMGDGDGLLYAAYDVSADNGVARGERGNEVPFLFPVEGGYVYAPGYGIARQRSYGLEGALDTVVDVLQKSRPELNGKGSAGGHHLRAGTESRRFLIDLNGGSVAGHGEYLALQSLAADLDDVGHAGVRKTLGHDERAGNLDYFTAHIVFSISPLTGRQIIVCLRLRRVPPWS